MWRLSCLFLYSHKYGILENKCVMHVVAKGQKALYMCFLKNSKVNYPQGSLMSCLLMLYKS